MLSLCAMTEAVSLQFAKTTPAHVRGDQVPVLRELDEIEFELSRVKEKAATLKDELLLFLLDMAMLHTKKKGIAALVQPSHNKMRK
jgi:hypothetical protein